MIANAWFTVNYFKVSFGQQDKLQQAIKEIMILENINISDNQEKIISQLLKTKNRQTIKLLKYFNNQVPHWFLSPWFAGEKRRKIYTLSQTFENNCIYALYDEKIVINKNWLNYLNQNSKILKDFILWNLGAFLQVRNPNVPDIPSKLIKPAVRQSLTSQKKNFWDIVIKETGGLNCIYTGKKIITNNYVIEHFIPYSFVSHDLIWNLIPADKTFNLIKSDKLPPLEKYFNSFYLLQEKAYKIVSRQNPKNKYLQDYLTLFPDLSKNTSFTKEDFFKQIQPIITIASNNGFEYLI